MSSGGKTLCTLDSLLMFGMVSEVLGGGLEVFGECVEVVWEVLHDWYIIEDGRQRIRPPAKMFKRFEIEDAGGDRGPCHGTCLG